MNKTGFPVFAILYKDEWFWLDMEWGNHHSAGGGWLMAIPWGEGRRYGWRDDRIALDSDDCNIFLLGWTHGGCPMNMPYENIVVECVYSCPNCDNKRANQPLRLGRHH